MLLATDGNLNGQTNKGSYDGFLLEIDPNGQILWTELFGTEFRDEFHPLALGNNGEVYIPGYSFDTSGNVLGDVGFLLKVNQLNGGNASFSLGVAYEGDYHVMSDGTKMTGASHGEGSDEIIYKNIEESLSIAYGTESNVIGYLKDVNASSGDTLSIIIDQQIQTEG